MEEDDGKVETGDTDRGKATPAARDDRRRVGHLSQAISPRRPFRCQRLDFHPAQCRFVVRRTAFF
jgi:hypothetical protein